MTIMTKALLKWAIIGLPIAAAAAAAPGPIAPSVRLTSGSVAGVRENDVDAFLGLPYAAPPVGALRWKPPQPVAAWNGVRSAAAPGNDCLQDSAHNPLPPGYSNAESEDCLYLNVWRPHGVHKRLPVMMWIHGGAFIMGSGSLPIYDGRALARQGVIVVTINYRLGRFGTYANPSLSAEQRGGLLANYGMMDQIAALCWIKANAAALGGDPDNVTIFGESAGASSVNFLMTSPLARGLFAKAISESGGSSENLQPLADGPHSAEATGLQWARSKGVPDGDLAALRALPAETVLDAPVRAPAFPVRDGRLILHDTTDAFRLGEAAPVPYLVGANDYEQSLMRWLPGAGDKMLTTLGDSAGPLLAQYQTAGVTREQAIGRLWGEQAMVEPARRRAKQQSAKGLPVWLYRFGYVPEALRHTLPGAGHDNEMQMVFATPSPAARPGWSAADQKMADLVSGYWVSFAKRSNPNMPSAPYWPPFAGRSDRIMAFSKDGAAVIDDFGKQRLDMIESLSSK